MKSILFFSALCLAHDAANLQKKYLPPNYIQPVTVDGPKSTNHYAKPYESTDPIYSCPKPGYILEGDKCKSTSTVESKVQCLDGYTLINNLCIRSELQVAYCNKGEPSGQECISYTYSEPQLNCPIGSTSTSDGRCQILELVDEIEVCPEGSVSKSHDRCVEYEYTQPEYVCPPDYELEGDKCTKETLSYKTKNKRILSEIDNIQDAEALTYNYLPEEYDYYHLQSSNENNLQCNESGNGENCKKTDWVPVVTSPKYYVNDNSKHVPRTKKEPTYHEELRWQKVKIQVPLLVPDKPEPREKVVKPKQEKIKVKSPKVVYEKEPKQIIKIISQAAEKVCLIGVKKNGKCVTEVDVEPELKCPVSKIDGICQRRKYTKSIASCSSTSANLVCPSGKKNSQACRCETVFKQPAQLKCPYDTVFDGVSCESVVEPSILCPVGYDLSEYDSTICVKNDVEPAFCTFTVSYICPECEPESEQDKKALKVPFPVPGIDVMPSFDSRQYYKHASTYPKH